jgi:YVTN family beta-propeller protein
MRMQTTRDECTHIPKRRLNKSSRLAQHERRAWVVGALAALCTALLPTVAPHASAAGGPQGHRDPAYVTNASDDTVSVIDTRTNQVIGSPIAVGDGPVAVAVDVPRARAYVTNQNDDTVSVINTRTNQVIGSPITVGDNPVAVAVDVPRARAYVTNANDDTVSVINTRTNQVIGSPITVGDNPFAVAVDVPRARAYVTNANDDTVSVIDTRTNQVIGSPITVGEARSRWRWTHPGPAPT